jgi:hypothetical protein
VIPPLAAAAQRTDQLTTDGLALKVCPDAQGSADYEIADQQRRLTL